MTEGGPLTAGWLTTAQAAELAGITPAAFRKEVQRAPRLRLARAYLGTQALYLEAEVRAWLADRPGRGARTDLQA